MLWSQRALHRSIGLHEPSGVARRIALSVSAKVGAEQRAEAERRAPSKLNCIVNVPATPLTLTAVRTPPVPPYACGAHLAVVADVHALLPHVSAAVSEAVADAPAAPKLKPLIVTVPPAVGAAFALVALVTGAASATLHTA